MLREDLLPDVGDLIVKIVGLIVLLLIDQLGQLRLDLVEFRLVPINARRQLGDLVVDIG